MRLLALALICLAGAAVAQGTVVEGAGTGGASARLQLSVGVRADAPPFSYAPGGTLLSPVESAGPLGKLGYAGYTVFLCDRVLETMRERGAGPEMTVTVVEVTTADRFEKLRADPAHGDKHIDILCDPATVTRERVREFSASLPLYLSGIGFAAQPREKISQLGQGCLPKIGLVESTTAFEHGLTRILAGNEWASYREGLLRYLYNPKGWMDEHPCAGEGAPVVSYKTHREVVKAFCEDEIQYYVGDLEIVNRALRVFGTCDFRPASTTYSDDRYVIFMRNAGEDDHGKARLLQTFSRVLSELVLTSPSLLDQAFQTNFSGYQPSDKLRLFFWSLYGP